MGKGVCNIEMQQFKYNEILQFKTIDFTGDCIANKRERTKRSDTAKRHILARQKQIDSSEIHNNISKTTFSEIRRYVSQEIRIKKIISVSFCIYRIKFQINFHMYSVTRPIRTYRVCFEKEGNQRVFREHQALILEEYKPMKF